MSANGERVDFEVGRTELAKTRFLRTPLAEPADGEIVVAIDRFAFTANNVTYAFVGESFLYWSFFPAEDGWGRVPVWGFADVVRSRHADVKEGERFYGYFPMSTHLAIEAGRVNDGGLVDVRAHRRELPPIYNNYIRCAGDPLHAPEHEDRIALFRPLFLTAFLLDAFLAENDFFGGKAVVLTSASSKTSFSLAHLLAKRGGPAVVGLTSEGNRSFVEGLGCYDEVVAYDAMDSLPADRPSVIVDMAGNADVLGRFYAHLGDDMKYACLVGVTHQQPMGAAGELPGRAPEFFFAPDHAVRMQKEQGAAAFQEKAADAWNGFLLAGEDWLRVERFRGEAEVERVYRETLAGKADPATGYILSLAG